MNASLLVRRILFLLMVPFVAVCFLLGALFWNLLEFVFGGRPAFYVDLCHCPIEWPTDEVES